MAAPERHTEQVEGWFVFEPDEDLEPSVIDASEWLDAPAGRHGFVQIEGDRLVFEDGTPARFWGANICNQEPGCPREFSPRWARFIAKYGANVVRFHKFTNPGEAVREDGPTSASLDPDYMDRMDFLCAELRKNGIYYGWSPIWFHRVFPDDPGVLAYEEIADGRRNTSYGLVNYAEDLQGLRIRLLRALLEHENPYTGLTYAEDPALSYVEIQNEDCIWWGSTRSKTEACPTYKALLCRRFSEWLEERYGDQESIVDAWGPRAIDEGESLKEGSFYPVPDHEYYNPDYLAEHPERRRRQLDAARFLFETQNAYYSRVLAAIRETGYRGPVVASPWKAGYGLPHIYNLRSDALVGILDRHNYFGGGAGRHTLERGEVNTASMLSEPGTGLLSRGFHMVADRPFQMSEWISKLPNEWVAEGPVLVACYGLGLQGWDASHHFSSHVVAKHHPDCSRDGFWWDMVGARENNNVYNVESPTQLGQYPVLARMVHRGDVAQGEPVAVRKTHVPSLQEEDVEFGDREQQEGDISLVAGRTPPEAMAVGRVQVAFTDEPEQDYHADLSDFWDRDARVLRSSTGQLTWDYAGTGHVIVDTPGTQGVIGFAAGERLELGDVVLEPETHFASIFVTALERNATIADGSGLLLQAISRARNTAMQYSEDGTELLEVGGPPVIVEGVKATVTIKARNEPTVRVLDHAGRRTNRTVEVEINGQDATFRIGPEHEALYYEIAF